MNKKIYNYNGGSMQRINIKDLTNIDEEYFRRVDENGRLIDGTSTMFFATNPYNGRTGILKQNGCVLGIDNEDLRERLASQILNLCGVNSANIELMVDDEGNHYCFSYNVLKENEEHVALSKPEINENDSKEEIFKNYMEDMFTSVSKLPGITEMQYYEIRKRLLQIYFMDLIIDHYDRKLVNCKIIYNKVTGEYKAPIGYDYGVAFSPDAMKKQELYMHLTNEEVMAYMLKYYYGDLEDTINNVFCILTDENIELILNNEMYKPLNPELISRELKYRVKELQELIFNLQREENVPQM